jgi:ribonuclease HI
VTRRRREPGARDILRFVAEHESLSLTLDEFPELGEERLRALLLDLCAPEPPSAEARTARAQQVKPPPRGKDGRGRVVLHTDGASRGNPGLAAAGWVLCTPDGEELSRGRAFLGRRTNNEAEYEAVIRGLTAALELGATEVALRADSELLVKQINGDYQVRNERIAALHARVRELMRSLRRVEAKHVRRELNAEADAEANRALDSAARAR